MSVSGDMATHHIIVCVDDELEVGDCRKENFSRKLPRSSQVWHGASTYLLIALLSFVVISVNLYTAGYLINIVVFSAML